LEEYLKKYEQHTKMFNDYVYMLFKYSYKKYYKILEEFAKVRNYTMETMEKHMIFYIKDMAEMIVPQYINSLSEMGLISESNNKPIFHDRFIIPIRDSLGNVINLVGYNSDFEEKYIYGTGSYYSRRDIIYGMENIQEAYRKGYAVLTEGITDAIALRNIGITNSFGNCGTHFSKITKIQLERCELGVIKIPDRDKVGTKASRNWKFNKSVTIYPHILYKDIDEMLREDNNREPFMYYFKKGLGILESRRFLREVSYEITIM
jgi:DNA primase